jgi:hypothetical protein
MERELYGNLLVKPHGMMGLTFILILNTFQSTAGWFYPEEVEAINLKLNFYPY